jgi:hypothetical protein
MKILMIDDQAKDADDAAERLDRAGHATTSCRPRDDRRVCRGVEPGGRCPLDDGVDVAVAPFSLDALERHGLALGYVCARRAGIPVVAIGDHTTVNPDPDTTILVHDLHDVAAVAAGAAGRPLEPHTAVARRAVRDSLDRHGADDIDVSAWVERRHGRLQIRVATSEPVTKLVGHAAAVRALGAVRAVDERASVIGVSVLERSVTSEVAIR